MVLEKALMLLVMLCIAAGGKSLARAAVAAALAAILFRQAWDTFSKDGLLSHTIVYGSIGIFCFLLAVRQVLSRSATGDLLATQNDSFEPGFGPPDSDSSTNPYAVQVRHSESATGEDTFLKIALYAFSVSGFVLCLANNPVRATPLWLMPGVVPMVVCYSVRHRRPWGFLLVLSICWTIILSPPFLFIGAAIGGQGKDSIGHGLAAVFSGVSLVTGTPLAGWIAYRLNRPAGRKLFNRSVTPMTDVEKTLIALPTAVLLLGIPALLILL